MNYVMSRAENKVRLQLEEKTMSFSLKKIKELKEGIPDNQAKLGNSMETCRELLKDDEVEPRTMGFKNG